MSQLSRRVFHQLTMAAAGGLAAGVAPLVAEEKAEKPKKEKHVCRGLNSCKNNGAGENACAGQGHCATVPHHFCAGLNACKGQGGCGTTFGANACKGKGLCAVPLKSHIWGKARAKFEAKMKKAEKKFGPAPKKNAKKPAK